MDLAKRIGLRSAKPNCKWDNPKESVGERLGSIGSHGHTCWQTVGQARDAWNAVRPDIKDHLNNFCPSNASLVIIEMYMIGKSEDTATPTILVCSSDRSTRKRIRQLIKENGFLDEYPGIGLADTAKLPDRREIKRLSESDFEEFSCSASVSSLSNFVWSEHPETNLDSPMDPSRVPHSAYEENREITTVYSLRGAKPGLGQKLFMGTGEGRVGRMATGGIVLWINGQSYQLSVRHILNEDLDEDHGAGYGDEDTVLSDEFSIGDGEDDNEDLETDETSERGALRRGSQTPDDLKSCDSDDDCPIETTTFCETEVTKSDQTFNSKGKEVARTSDRSPSTPNSPISTHLGEAWAMLHDTEHQVIGKVSLTSPQDKRCLLDYLLVRLDEPSSDPNIIPFQQDGVSHPLLVSRAAAMSSHDVDVVTWTVSKGQVTGRLFAQASYIRLPNEEAFHELFLVRLNDVLREGDCGAAIIDQNTGNYYGHIVAGTPGTGFAYILPAIKVFNDISARMGADIEMQPPETSSSVANIGNQHCDSDLGSSSNDQPASTQILEPPLQFDHPHHPISNPFGLPCEFIQYELCDRWFEPHEVEDWITHIVEVHMNSNCPSHCSCWFCDRDLYSAKSSSSSDRKQCYRRRMHHIAKHIQRQEFSVEQIRPDFDFIKHIRRIGVLGAPTYNYLMEYAEVPNVDNRSLVSQLNQWEVRSETSRVGLHTTFRRPMDFRPGRN